MSKVDGVGKVTREPSESIKYKPSHVQKKIKNTFAQWLGNPQYNVTGPIPFGPASNSHTTASGVN